MNPGEHRREYAAFCSALERARYELHAGHTAEAHLQPIYERYGDLWTREAIENLQRASEDAPAQFETERAGLRALGSASRHLYVEAQAADATRELARCEAAARIAWDGERVAASDVPERIETETDATRRRELAARLFDALAPCDDLRAARFVASHDAARALGFDDERRMREETTGADDEKLVTGADAFLARTSSAYFAHLAQWTTRELGQTPVAAPHYGDSLFLRRLMRLDTLFASHDFPSVYGATMNALLGVRVKTQKNIRIDDEARPLKKQRAASFAVDVPDAIYLVVHPRSVGARACRDFFYQAGRAQFFGWSSRESVRRYPEFAYAPDGATREGHASLIAGLFQDAAWLGTGFGFREREAKMAARAFAFAELYEMRLSCARLRYRLALDAATDVREEQLAETYATLHTEATGFRFDAATSLFDETTARGAQERLRASLFAASLREYLRGRHGRRWWRARGAGDELIDIWNTASRYSVEELARLVGAGELDFELLADDLLTTLNDE